MVQLDEECDDGNDDDADGCSNGCRLPGCGDGIVQAGEECDAGPDNSDTPDACRSDCRAPTCGDGITDPSIGELCDDGAANGLPGSSCSHICGYRHPCGDGVLEPEVGEECDDGNENNNDSCTTNCSWNACGDGAVYTTVTNPDNPNPIEECDDANGVETDSCRSTCEYNVCGDGVVLLQTTSDWDDPDGSGQLAAGRGGKNHDYHCLSAEDVEACLYPPELSYLPLTALEVEECDDGDLTNDEECVEVDLDDDGFLECVLAD